MEDKSFIYTLSSEERINNEAITDRYIMSFGGFADSPHNNYKVEVVNCILNGFVLNDHGFIMLICDGLNSNGSFCSGMLGGSETIICPISTNEDVLMSSGGIQFEARDIRTKRQVEFYFKGPFFEDIEDGVDINLTTETVWLLTLKMTPID